MNYRNILLNKIKSPSVIIKIALISIVFIITINIQLPILMHYNISLTGENNLSSTLFIIHIFSYFELYAEYLVVGLIILIPDIISEPYLTHQIYLMNKDRKQLFKNTIFLIIIYILAFLIWFMILTFIFSLFRVRIFHFSWPRNLMENVLGSAGATGNVLLNIPYSCTKYPLPIVLILIMLKSFLGFFIIALASFYISFKKNNVGFGIGLAVALFVISDMLYFSGFAFGSPGNILTIITNCYSLCAFFTFENIRVNFIKRIIQVYIYGIIVIGFLLLLIYKEMKKKDLS